MEILENRIGKLIRAIDEDGEVGLFRIVKNLCPEDHIDKVIQEYFEEDDEDNADLHLMRWGIEEVYIDYEVNVFPAKEK